MHECKRGSITPSSCEIKTESKYQSSVMSGKLNIGGGLQPMCFDGNISVNWKKWLQLFTIFLKASGIHEDTDERKIAVLLHYSGEKCLEIFNSFDLDIETTPYNEVITKFNSYFVPK